MSDFTHSGIHTLNLVRTHLSEFSDAGSSCCEDASASVVENEHENYPMTMEMVTRQNDLFKHAKNLIMRGRPDNEGLREKMLARDNDNETGNLSLIGNCSGNGQCCVDELTGEDRLFATTCSSCDAQHDDAVRRNEPNACDERITTHRR